MARNNNNAWPVLGTQQQGEVAGNESGSQQAGDPLHLHGSDHPGLSLVTTPLTGKNYLPWSHAKRLALGAKTKLDFIDGTVAIPANNSTEYVAWKKVDCMVTSWILNSLSKEVRDGFVYAKSSKLLWDDLKERYGQSNGPLLYQLKKEMAILMQGNDDISEHYTKLRKLWDEYDLLAPTLVCDCAIAVQNSEIAMASRMIDFLMGLNDTFDHVRSQILLMDPLPSINKVYSMLQSVEKQRLVNLRFPNTVEYSAMMMRVAGGGGRGAGGRGSMNQNINKYSNYAGRGDYTLRRSREEKANLICEHCGYKGHEMAECFKLHGIPNWYKNLKDQQGGQAMNIIESRSTEIKNSVSGNMLALLQRELTKFFAGKLKEDKGN